MASPGGLQLLCHTMFRQRDLTAAVKALRAVGIEVARIEIDSATGRIVLVTASDIECYRHETPLEKWLAKPCNSDLKA
jgi:hypothetical protein